jgi:hypothetical protein
MDPTNAGDITPSDSTILLHFEIIVKRVIPYFVLQFCNAWWGQQMSILGAVVIVGSETTKN